MIRYIWLTISLRLRLLRNGLRLGIQRGEVAALGAIAEVVMPVVLTLFVLAVAAIVFGLAIITGHQLAAPEPNEGAIVAVRMVTASLMFTTLMAPGFRAGRTSAAERHRLLLLPISRRLLHGAELVANVADPWILMIFPGLLALSVGVYRYNGFAAGTIALAAGVLLLFILVELASLSTALANILMRDRRRSELLVVLFMICLMLVALVPVLMDGYPGSTRTWRPVDQTGELPSLDSTFLWWLQIVPSEAHGRTVFYAARGSLVATIPSLLVLAVTAIVLYGLSWVSWRRLVESPTTCSSSTRTDVASAPLLRLPWLRSGPAAVAQVEVLMVLRTVRGKLAVFLTPLTMVVLSLALSNQGLGQMPQFLRSSPGPFLAMSGMCIGLLSLLGSTVNQFGSARAGLSRQLLMPISDHDLIVGKAVGGGILAVMASAPCVLLAATIVGGSMLEWTTVLLVGLSTYISFAPAAAWLSILFPKRADLGAVGRAGNPHPVANVGGSLLTVVCLLPPALLASVTATILGRPALALALVTIWLLFVTTMSWALLRIAADFFASRRDDIALTAERS